MVAPHLLEAGDVVELSIPTDTSGKMVKTRHCKILSIGDPDAFFHRDSRIEWLDSYDQESMRWKAAKGVNSPVWVVAGPKINAALRREASVRKNDMGRWIWEGYLETVGG